MTFNRRGVLWDLPAATPTAPAVVEGKAPGEWAKVVPFHGKEPALRWMRNGKVDEGVKPWPAPPPSPIRVVEFPKATSHSTSQDDVEDSGDEEEEGWVILERPPKYKPVQEGPKSQAPTATPTRSESGPAAAAAPVATLWGGGEGSGEEVLEVDECGEVSMGFGSF